MNKSQASQLSEANRRLIKRLYLSNKEEGYQVEFGDTKVIITNSKLPRFRKEIPNADFDRHLRHGIRMSSSK